MSQLTGTEAIVGVSAAIALVMLLTFGRRRRKYRPGPENEWQNENYVAVESGEPSQNLHDDWSNTAPSDYSGGFGGGVSH